MVYSNRSEKIAASARSSRPAAPLVTLSTLMLFLLVGAGAPPALADGPEPPYPHGSFEEDCSICHSSNGWKPVVIRSQFDHSRTGFALDGAHRTALCRSCHISLEFSKASPACGACHADVHQGELGADCAQCHSTSNFVDRADEVRSHRMTAFPLTGAHRSLDCVACHSLQPQGGLRFVNTPMDCEACHLGDFQATTNPDHVALGFDRDCVACHAATSWAFGRLGGFDHDVTGFSLSGAHRGLDCATCHGNGGFATAASQCFSCHRQDFEATTQPNHMAGGFATDCGQCHGSSAWSPAAFDHDVTAFPLTGSHAATECSQCHAGGSLTAVATDCNSCHQNDYQQAPGHTASNFPLSCEQCHNTVQWSSAVFNHGFFPFVGGHSGVSCEQCHTTGVYAPIAADCQSCHQADYQQAPGHAGGGFPATCEDCHSVNTWLNAAFDHSFFPLSGGHNGVQCVTCHTNGSYGTIPADCAACHQADYQQAPGHATSGFPTTCDDCHSVSTWLNAAFDHSFFPLSGGHNGVQCVTCHTNGTYGTIPTDCAACHQDDYQQAPGHASSGFPTTCDDCHSVSTWLNAAFDHSFFPLSGGHNGVQCVTCHTNGTYGTIPTDCAACHQDDYQQAPGHASSGFPTTCDDCHSVSTWLNAAFDHSFFPLSGGHNGVQCVTCHTNGTYGTIPTDCAACHQNDYQQAPGHATSGFPTTCDDCHSVSTWLNASFDHSFFPLSGGHNGMQCVACHTNGTYGTIPAECAFCHQADYVEAPGHVASGFPTTCDDCHSVSTWLNAAFDHSFFPLSGGHNGMQCVACHTNGSYGTIPAECAACHLDDYQQAPGHATSGFPTTCDDCHGVNTWLNASFDHAFFPLSGGHNGLTCVQCHTTGTYGTLPSDCYSCHQSEYVAAPDHQALNFPLDCESCHNNNSWQNVNFVHSFPLNGPHGGRQCQDCHNTGTTADFSCLGACHKHTQPKMDEKHKEESGYSYDFFLCLSCHPNGRS